MERQEFEVPRTRLERVRLIVVLLTLAGVVALWVPSPTHATAANLLIVPGKSVGLIKLGDPPSKVRQLWGAPTKVVRPQSNYEMWQYDRYLATVHVQDNEVTLIQTSSPVFRTPQGVGPGSPRAQLLRAYGNPTWSDNLGPVTIYAYASIGLLASFRNDDPSYISGLSVVMAPMTR